jgi:integrase
MSVRGSTVRKELRGGKPRWIIDFRFRDKDGRECRYRRDAAVQTAAGARAEAERLRLQAATTGSLETRVASGTFRAFAEGDFASIFMAAKCRPATRERYKAILRQGVLDAFGLKRLDRITAVDVRAYEATLVRRGIQARAHIALVRSVLRAAVDLGALDKLPELPSLPRRGRKVPDVPGTEDVALMLARAQGWIRPTIALAVFAGLRMGEIRAIEVRDVDLKRDRILVRRALSGTEVMTPKSGHERLVPLAPELKEALIEAMRLKLPTTRIILNARGKTPGRQAVLTKLKELQEKCELPARSFHSLRHYFCSTLIRRGASVEAVRQLAGHSALAITQLYVHANAADLTTAIAKLSAD